MQSQKIVKIEKIEMTEKTEKIKECEKVNSRTLLWNLNLLKKIIKTGMAEKLWRLRILNKMRRFWSFSDTVGKKNQNVHNFDPINWNSSDEGYLETDFLMLLRIFVTYNESTCFRRYIKKFININKDVPSTYISINVLRLTVYPILYPSLSPATNQIFPRI